MQAGRKVHHDDGCGSSGDSVDPDICMRLLLYDDGNHSKRLAVDSLPDIFVELEYIWRIVDGVKFSSGIELDESAEDTLGLVCVVHGHVAQSLEQERLVEVSCLCRVLQADLEALDRSLKDGSGCFEFCALVENPSLGEIAPSFPQISVGQLSRG